MNLARVIYHLARADFLERVRRNNFYVILGFTIYLGYIFVPPAHSRYATMQMAGHRGFYNSAYIGAAEAMLTAVFLSLIGFYLVKNALDRDLQTRVGQILATTPLTKPAYTLGKALSNFAVLAVMVAVMALAAGVMQLVRGEDTVIHPWPLCAPFVLILLPVMAVVGSVAILFETIGWLRRGLGNVVYFFVWVFSLSVLVAREDSGTWAQWNDLMGVATIFPSISAACESAFPGCGGTKNLSMGFNIREEGQFWDLTTFHWEGIHWSAEIIAGRLFWVGVAVAIGLLAAFFFRRFDPALEGLRLSRKQKRAKSQEDAEAAGALAQAAAQQITLTPLAPRGRGTSFPQLVRAELRLMLKGRLRWWYIAAAGLFVASAAVPFAEAREVIAGFAWIWPVLIWSQMGSREARFATESLVFSSERALYRQLPAVWSAGVLVALLTGGGYGLSLLFAGNARGLLGWLLALMFIPSLALALGVWSGSGKLFEVIFTFWWYMGPMSRAPGIDFLNPAPGNQALMFYVVMTASLLVAAFFGRRMKLGYA